MRNFLAEHEEGPKGQGCLHLLNNALPHPASRAMDFQPASQTIEPHLSDFISLLLDM